MMATNLVTRYGRLPYRLSVFRVAVWGCLAFQLPFSVPSASAQVSQATTQRVVQAYSSLPLRFERNEGQADPRVKFLAHGSGYTLFLTPTETVLSLRHTVAPDERQTTTLGSGSVPPMPLDQTETVMLGMKLVGNNPAPEIAGFRELPGKVNYYIGNDRTKWRTHVSTFEKIVYKQAYPGIDLVFYGNQGRLEYDFIVAPGANPSAIALAFEGAEKMEINSEGDLVVGIHGGEVRLHKPAIYQEAAGKREPVSGAFVVEGRHKVGFAVARYDARKPLIIDPVLVYSTFLGGKGDDQGLAIAADDAGNAYVTGFTLSADFPHKNAEQAQCGDNGQCDFIPFPPPAGFVSHTAVSDAFVAKIDTTKSGANSLIYSTFLGGGPLKFRNSTGAEIDLASGADVGNAIAVDASGNAYVAGNTSSADFPHIGDIPRPGVVCIGSPTNPFVFQGACFVEDAFVSKFDPSGALVYSTPLGGQIGPICGPLHSCFDPLGGFDIGADSAHGIAVDNAGNAYVIGSTDSNDLLTTPGAFQTTLSAASGNGAAFLVKIDTTKTGMASLVYSSYFGTTTGFFNPIGTAIALDSANNVYVTGKLRGGLDSVPTTPGVLQTAADSGFVAKFDLTKTGNQSLLYSTYFPIGTGGPSGIAVDKDGNAYLTGDYDNALTFPVTPGAYDSCVANGPSLSCAHGIFVSKLNATGTALIYSARLGDSPVQSDFFAQPGGIAVDPNANAYITGTATFGAIENALFQKVAATPFPGNLLVGDCLPQNTNCFAGAYVTMMNPQGAIVYSNLLSGDSAGCGNGDSFGHGVAVDSAGNAYFTGATCIGTNTARFFPTTHFPITTNAFQNTIGSVGFQLFDAYLLKLEAVVTCASNLSGSVSITRGGFRYNFTTKRFVQNITLTNKTLSAIQGPISVALDGLSSNATLFSPAGITSCAAPLGSPFVNASLGTASSLGPGASVSLVLQFTDPSLTGITYTTQLLAGSGNR